MRPPRYLVLVALALVVPAASGCLHARASTVTGSPPLETPPAPPRLVETADVTPPAPVGLIEEPARQPVARPAPRPSPPRPAANAGRAEGTEPPKADQADPPRATEEPARAVSPPTLQTTPAGAEGEVERAIRVVLARATADLGRVNYRALNADARTQYDTAKRFIEQADDALRKRNLVYARNLADKALGLAAQLAP